jgi:hypothetical protein
MKTGIRVLSMLAAFALALFAFGAAAQDARSPANEPSVAQIYQAANSGNVDRANTMVDEVLRAHPNSGKAHYVKAELAAREGKTQVARQELATAEKFAPGLPFAKPASVQALRNEISNASTNATTNATSNAPTNAATRAPATTRQMGAAPAQHSFPWGTLIVVGAIVLIGMAVLRRRTAAMAANNYGNNYGDAPYGQPGYGAYPPNTGGMPPTGYGPGYGPSYGPPQQSSMGSNIARGVGTGLAMGAGMVAAEEIGHRMFGHNQSNAGAWDPNTNNVNTPSLDQIDDGMRRNLNSDMGGADFGINGGGSWDDGGGGDIGGGGGDWDT